MTERVRDEERQSGRLTITGGLTVVQVGGVKELLLQGFAAAEQLTCDLAAVDEVDLAGLQLLCAAHRFAVDHGKTMQLSGIGQPFLRLQRDAGFVRATPCINCKGSRCFWVEMA